VEFAFSYFKCLTITISPGVESRATETHDLLHPSLYTKFLSAPPTPRGPPAEGLAAKWVKFQSRLSSSRARASTYYMPSWEFFLDACINCKVARFG